MCFGAICGRGDINLVINNNIVLYARPESTILLLVFDYFPSRRCANKKKTSKPFLIFITVSISLLSSTQKQNCFTSLLKKSFAVFLTHLCSWLLTKIIKNRKENSASCPAYNTISLLITKYISPLHKWPWNTNKDEERELNLTFYRPVCAYNNMKCHL
jgi:hypothetical protein